jgi:hypothetical protein
MRVTLVLTGTFLLTTTFVCAQAPTPETKEAQANAARGIPPRASPTDYQAQAKAGSVTIAAEFAGHSVPKPEGPLSTEDFVVVEVGYFGAPSEKLKLSIEDFTLRINGKKGGLPSQPFGLVAGSLKDPEWQPPDQEESKPKSKSGLSTGANGGADSTPAPVHVPIELRRAMAQYVQKAALPEGERALPQAGLIFFRYAGRVKSIHSIELIYSGPAGNATLSLQP